MYVLGENPFISDPNSNKVREALSNLDFLVVQDMYHTTETAQMADLVLPAAGWGEKEGTFINSERRIGVLKKVRKAPGEALSDFSIFRLIAEYWGVGKMFEKWSSHEAVFQILKRLSEDQPCDITGVDDYRMIDEAGVGLAPGTAFGPGGEDGWYRLCFARSHESLQTAMERMCTWLDKR